MDPKMLTEVWQAFCTLSDAQEFLGGEGLEADNAQGIAQSASLESANDRINHAKRHLQGVIEEAERTLSANAFVQSISALACTLGEGETHEEGG